MRCPRNGPTAEVRAEVGTVTVCRVVRDQDVATIGVRVVEGGPNSAGVQAPGEGEIVGRKETGIGIGGISGLVESHPLRCRKSMRHLSPMKKVWRCWRNR